MLIMKTLMNFKTIACGLIVMAGLTAIPKPAHAQVAVLCQSCETHLPQIDVSTKQLATSFNKYQAYMTTGMGGTGSSMGGGVIEQLQALNDGMAESTQQQVQNANNGNTLAQIREYIKTNAELNKTHLPSDQINACADASMSAGFATSTGGGSSGGGSGASQSGGQATAQERAEVRDRNYSAIANAGSKMLDHVQNYCTKEDVANKRLGCSAEGTYAGADTDARSLTYGAQTKGDTSPALPSLDDKQLKVAQSVMTQVIPNVPAGATANSNNSPAANQYNVDANSLKAKISFADEALTASIGLYAGRKDLPAEFMKTWSGSSEEFKRVYGATAKQPTNPSKFMMYEFEIMRKLTDPEVMGGENTKSPQDIAADNYKLNLLRARIELDNLATNDRNGRMLAALLTQTIDPQTTDSLKVKLAALTNKPQ